MRWFYLAPMAALIGYVLVVGALYLGQRSLLYRPSAGRPSLGGLAALGAHEATLHTEDGLRLFAWYLPPPAGAPVIVYFHGNGGDIGHRADRLRRFAEVGFGALMVEYRGYAGNPGAPTEAGLLADARAALAFLDAQRVAPNRRVLYGESLGTGVTVQLAADHPIAALILESPYTSVADVAQYHYPWVPVRWLLHDKFDSRAVIGRVQAPILFLHAERDTVIPARFGRALYAAAPAPKEAWSTNEGDHEDVGRLGGVEAAIAFVRRRFGARVVDHAASNG
jgi:fermentation-respiration switch protein FrsA (DUF1100 family)